MPKQFDFSKSGLKKLTKKLEADTKKTVKEHALKGEHTITCQHCSKPIQAKAGNNVCPHCRQVTKLSISFKG